jgi:biopolymer transport protein ExbD/biopolymer transport protein TolR
MAVELNVGGGKGRRSDVKPSMNVTPLVDVVLVLLIIFMVIAPMMVKQFWLHVPKKEAVTNPEAQAPSDGPVPIVVTVRADRSVWINKDQVELATLGDRLQRIFAARTDRLVFFDAEDAVPYGDAMRVLDAARGGGAANIAVLTDAVR